MRSDEEQKAYIQHYYQEKVDGFVVPVWLSAVKHLDYETDEKIYLAVKAGRYSQTGKMMYDYAYFSLPVRRTGSCRSAPIPSSSPVMLRWR